MKTPILVLFSALIASTALAAPSVEARGIRIVGEGYKGDDALRPFNWMAGTSVSLLVTRPEGGIINLDRDTSSVKAFTDDKGKDLMAAESNSFSSGGIEMMPSISKDGTACLFEVKVPGTPTKGAANVKLAGELAFQVASKTEQLKSPKVAIKIGEKVTLGSITFEIQSIGKPTWSDQYNYSITLQSTDDLSTIKDLAFLDANGTPIKSSRGSTSSFGGMGKTQYSWEYQMNDPGEHVIISATRWTDMQMVKLPFNVEAGIGLS